MSIYDGFGLYGSSEEVIRAQHRVERLEDIERLKESAPIHHKSEIDRLWELVKDFQ